MKTVVGVGKLVFWCSFICVLFLAWTPFVSADEVEDWMIESRLDRYYDLPKTARVVGMGGASWVTSNDISSVFGNPAGLGFATGPELGITYSHDEYSGRDSSFAPFIGGNTGGTKAAGNPIFCNAEGRKNQGGLQLVLPGGAGGSCGVFGFGAWVDDTNFDDCDDTDAQRYRFNAGYGLKLNDCLSLGYSLTYFNDDVEDRYSDYNLDDGFRHDIGLQLRPGPGCTFGLRTFYAHGNPDTDITTLGSDEGDLDSWGVEFGYSWQVLPCTLLAASVDYQDREYDGIIYAPDQDEIRSFDEEIKGWGFHVGLEQNYRDCLFPRLGYRYQTNDYDSHQVGQYFRGRDDFESNYHAVSTGIGWAYNKCLTLDYGMEYRFIGDGDLNNTVTARFHF